MHKILLIEDEEDLVEEIRTILRGENVEVISTDYGEKVIALAARTSPDLIILDMELPAMDGYAVLDQLRHNRVHAGIPFVFLTDKADRRDTRGVEKADDYITKPITSDRLMNTVRALLEQAEALHGLVRKSMMSISEAAELLIAEGVDTDPAALLKLSQLLSILAGVEAYHAPDREDRIYGGESEQEARPYIDAIIQTYPRGYEEKVQLQEGVNRMIEAFRTGGLEHKLARDNLKKLKRRITERIQIQEPSESVQTFFEKLRKKQETP